MPNIFISYRHDDKEIVTRIVKHLQKSFVHVWIDDHKNLPPGSIVAGGISQGIQKCDIFMPFISAQYLDSDYCLEELSIANSYRIKSKLKIIPIVIDKNFNTTQINIDNQKASLLQTLLETTKYIMVDTEEAMNHIVDAVWNDEKVRFQPIEYIQMQNVNLQKIT
ncbi:TIR domain-containing protein, partial [candidate division KSB1 bacterium]|nr:TIR domain-containing protein [candidate division KSB1 bacterium]